MSISIGKVRIEHDFHRHQSNFFSSIFGFASLFDVLFRYGIYQSRCEVLFEEIIANETMKVTKDCRQQLVEFELAFALGLGFYHLPAVVLSMIEHFFGAKALKIIGM